MGHIYRFSIVHGFKGILVFPKSCLTISLFILFLFVFDGFAINIKAVLLLNIRGNRIHLSKENSNVAALQSRGYRHTRFAPKFDKRKTTCYNINVKNIAYGKGLRSI